MVALGIPGIDAATHIGSGGNADVYRARESDHDRWVAVKVLRGTDEAAIRRFNRERKAMGRLSGHDGIVTIHHSGLTDAGDPYVVMVLCENGSLQDRINSSGPIDWREACTLVADVADAVQFAHERGVIHRDLKPSNILISPQGRPLVADFGIARLAESTTAMHTTALAFTPAFSAPEVIDGGESSTSADVYALGATLSTLLAGRPPFTRAADESVFAVMKRIATEPPASLRGRGIPDGVCDVVDATLSKQPTERPAGAGELARLLRRLVDTDGASGAAGPAVMATAVLPDSAADAPGVTEPGPTAPGPTARMARSTPPPAAVAAAPVSETGAGGTRRAILIMLVFAAVLAGAVGLIAAIGRGGDDPVAEPAPSEPPATVTDTTVAPTTVVPATTVAAATTVAPTTTEPVAVIVPDDGDSDRPVAILDTDANNEVDDQFAIAYLLLADEFRTPGITVNRTRLGGSIEDQVAEAERVIELVGRSDDVPAFAGASGSFDEIVDQLGEDDFDGKPAVDFIVETARAEEGEVLLLPIGKLTNIALALASAPDIADDVRILWLGSNYPSTERSEYNLDNDPAALQFLLDVRVPFEIAVVRIGEPSGTAAVTVTPAEIAANLRGAGPTADPPVAAADGTTYTNFGDYGISLFDGIQLFGDPPSRSLYDVAAVAVALDRGTADSVVVSRPDFEDGGWVDQPGTAAQMTIWENFDRDAIVDDLFDTIQGADGE